MLGTAERMKTGEEKRVGLEAIKGGFPLPINQHVHNCNSSGKLSKLSMLV